MQNAFKIILETSIYSSIMIAFVLLVKSFLSGKLSTKVMSILWITVLIRLAMPITFESPVHLFTLASTAPSAIENMVNEEMNIPSNASAEYIDNYNYVPTDNSDIQPTAPTGDIQKPTIFQKAKSFIVGISLWTVAFLIWAIGAVFVFAKSLALNFDFRKRITKTNVVSPILEEKLYHAKSILNINKDIKITESKYANIPFVYGYLKPIILLPVGFSHSISSKKLSLIILHELCHVKRGDILKNFCWLVVKSLHWFNPLVQISYKNYLENIEEVCDEVVLSHLSKKNKLEYGQSLIDIVRLSKNKYDLPLSVSFCNKKTTIRKRVIKIMNPQKKSITLGVLTLLVSLIMIFACFTTACQPKVTKADNNLLDESFAAKLNNQLKENIEDNINPKETPAPTSTISIGSNNNTKPQPIKRNPIVTEEAAIAVAKKINISNADSFTYVDSFDRGVMKVHLVKADGDDFTNYQIYDFNGEILSLQSPALLPKELGKEQTTDVLKQKVIDFAMEIYPNTKLDITSCVKDDRTWKTDGVEYQSKDYIITGKLTDGVDGSVRSFSSNIRLDGYVKSISAEYSGIDYLGISDEVKRKVLSYAETADTEIEIYQISEYYGDHILHFSIGDKMGMVTLLGTDKSLVDYLNIPNQTDVEFNLSDSQIDELVKQYADYYFPDNTSVIIDDDEVIDNDYVGEGVLTDSRGEMDFYIQLNGDGKIHKIGIRPNVEKQVLTKIDKSVALQKAKDILFHDCPFVEESRLEILSEEEYVDEYTELYIFEFKYTSLNPTIYDYSLNAYVNIDAYSGKTGSWRIDYIEDELDLITREEAIEKAKEYIVAEYNVDPEKLIFKDFTIMTWMILEFQVDFDYEDGKSYGASMYADTGARDGVGWGGP